MKSTPLTFFSSKAAVRQILRPFRHEADAKTGRDQRHQREGVVAGVGDIVGQIVLLEFLREIALAVGEVLTGREMIFSLRRSSMIDLALQR